MNIAIDYDDTYTLDPNFWLAYIQLVKEYGHTIYCVTGRKHEHAVSLGFGIMTIYAPTGYKRDAVKECGITIDVWIDDMPGFIEPSRVLEGF